MTPAGAVFQGSAPDLSRMHETFVRQQALALPRFLPDNLLYYIRAALSHAAFEERGQEGLCAEMCLSLTDPIRDHLIFLLNDPALFRWVERITGCDPIGCFGGRVYRRAPGGNHYDNWHDDDVQARMIGISVNLSIETFGGGALRLREKASQNPLYEFANTGFGDAVLFRVSERLEHIVLPLDGTAERTALAGWFRREPDYMANLTEAASAPHPPSSHNADTLPAQWRVSEHALYHAIGDDLLIHVNGRAEFFRLDAVGREISERLAATGATSTVIAQMLDEYDVSAHELTRGVHRVIAGLRGRGVLERVLLPSLQSAHSL